MTVKGSCVADDHPSQAQPLPLWQTLSREMQLFPQALPLEQTLQHAKEPVAADAADEHGLMAAGPIASEAAARRMLASFKVTLPG